MGRFEIMVKNLQERIRKDERKLLLELQKNSKENIDTIAKYCGFSRQKTWRMIKQLEKDHEIWGYSAIVDTEKQGLQKFILLLKRSNLPFEKKDIDDIVNGRIGDMFEKLGIRILTTYYIQGEYDWVVIFTAEDIRQALKVRDLLANKLSYASEKINLSQVLVALREHTVINPDQQLLKDLIH